MAPRVSIQPETQRLLQDARRQENWKRWGPYLAERQWGTVREDYSADGNPWTYFTHEHSRSRAYRWGEDGLLGITDRECRLCFALALWNGQDPILKERLFGLSNPEGNHGEDVKECYYYLESTPTHSHLKALYKYPQRRFPYEQLREENQRRSRLQPEFELEDTGIFDDHRYFDVVAEYAKASPNDILIRFTIANRGPDAATLHVLPTLWFRNTWSWGGDDEDAVAKPALWLGGEGFVQTEHATLGSFVLAAAPAPGGKAPAAIFTENETNNERLFNSRNPSPYVKDTFHEFIVHGRSDAVNPKNTGTKAALHYVLEIPAQGTRTIELRLYSHDDAPAELFGRGFTKIFRERIREADRYYRLHAPREFSEEQQRVARQAYAGLFWTKQFYHYVVAEWLDGDPNQPPPPQSHKHGRNADWRHLYNRDLISMPDKWEYPWYASWDLAFQMVAMARLDPAFAKEQMVLFLREWYMHASGKIPSYEFNFDDVNPPVSAWSAWRIYKITGARKKRDRVFLERVFQKHLIGFTWWVNRKDVQGKNLFAGGFLGLDNIGVFDRSQPLPGGGYIEQADGTAWMAFYCLTMLAMAMELAHDDAAYEDIASKFFEHFVAIVDAMNGLGGTGLWDETDGFYYDRLQVDGAGVVTRIRSIVGLIPLIAVEILRDEVIERLPGFRKRMQWFLDHRQDLAGEISYMEPKSDRDHGRRLLAIPSRARLERVLAYMLDENEFLSPYGIRSLSKYHREHPYVCEFGGQQHRVDYEPGESSTGLFGGNSNWRGPVWFPINYLLIEALERYHHFYGDEFRVECPTRSGRLLNLSEAAHEISRRLTRLFLPDAKGERPCHGGAQRYAQDPHWRDLVLFYEYFHGDSGKGLGASHQTGWTALAARLLENGCRQPRVAATQLGRLT
jgi:hypothetical protein